MCCYEILFLAGENDSQNSCPASNSLQRCCCCKTQIYDKVCMLLEWSLVTGRPISFWATVNLLNRWKSWKFMNWLWRTAAEQLINMFIFLVCPGVKFWLRKWEWKRNFDWRIGNEREILTVELGMKRVSIKLMPHLLTNHQKQSWMSVGSWSRLFSKVITYNESCAMAKTQKWSSSQVNGSIQCHHNSQKYIVSPMSRQCCFVSSMQENLFF